jgi:hypothetical protein
MSRLPAPNKALWYLYRLRAMDPTEIAERLLQRARLAAYRPPSHALAHFQLGDPTSTSVRLPDRSKAPDGVREAIGRDVARIRAGHWLMFGWKETQVCDPPAWHHDFANDADAPFDAEARGLDYRHLPGGADARCIWETNRWSEMVRLAQNALVNDVVDDARLAQRWLADWCENNPLGTGINWCSALEASLRLINFCWIDALIRECQCRDLVAMQNDLAQRIVPAHTWWIWHHRSLGSSANNHLLGELSAVVIATRRWPTLQKLACYTDVAWGNLSAEVMRQFSEDGGNREQALHYHHFAWELVWQATRVMDEHRGPVTDRLCKAARFFCDLVHEWEPWDFGDSDDAQVTPVASERQTAIQEWRAWLLREPQGAAIRFWRGVPPGYIGSLQQGSWKCYPSSGLAVQEVNAWKVRVDGSPLGLGRMAAHGHLDAMHVSIWDGRHALVVDPGTGAYFRDPGVRATLASWELHNGPLPLTGRRHPRRVGAFLWVDHHPQPLLSLAGECCTVQFVASPRPAITRTIRYLRDSDGWCITDEVAGDEPHVVRWRLAPGWTVLSRNSGAIVFAGPGHRQATLVIDCNDLLDCDVGSDLVSPHFGDLREALVVAVTFRQRLTSQWQRLVEAGHQCR